MAVWMNGTQPRVSRRSFPPRGRQRRHRGRLKTGRAADGFEGKSWGTPGQSRTRRSQAPFPATGGCGVDSLPSAPVAFREDILHPVTAHRRPWCCSAGFRQLRVSAPRQQPTDVCPRIPSPLILTLASLGCVTTCFQLEIHSRNSEKCCHHCGVWMYVQYVHTYSVHTLHAAVLPTPRQSSSQTCVDAQLLQAGDNPTKSAQDPEFLRSPLRAETRAQPMAGGLPARQGRVCGGGRPGSGALETGLGKGRVRPGCRMTASQLVPEVTVSNASALAALAPSTRSSSLSGLSGHAR
jgi:hypothetical protein